MFFVIISLLLIIFSHVNAQEDKLIYDAIDSLSYSNNYVGGYGIALMEDFETQLIQDFETQSIFRTALEDLASYPIYPQLQEGVIINKKPIDLVSAWRFDIMAKYIYAKLRQAGIETVWGRELYVEHLKVWNNISEKMPIKNSAEDYLNSFNEILDSVKNEGFLTSKSIVPIDKRMLISNGAHRVASCLLYGIEIPCKFYSQWLAPCATAHFFSTRQHYVKGGLQKKYLDNMALEYATLKSNTYIACCFPATFAQEAKVKGIISSYGIIVHEKNIDLTALGANNLIKELYNNEPWLGSWNNNFAGAQNAAKYRFPQGGGRMKAFLFECPSLKKVVECKTKIRALFTVGNAAIHINDFHKDTVLMAKMFFNNNSIHFLNYAQPQRFEKFKKYFAHYKQWLASQTVDPEYFCVDSSAVMSAYGMRDCADLDFLHHGFDRIARNTGNSMVSSHNSSLGHHTIGLDEIIFNPDNYFYYKGLKFASIQVIKNMKNKRHEVKDINDIKLIQANIR